MFGSEASLTFKIFGDSSGIKKSLADASGFVSQFVKTAEKGGNFSNFKNSFSSIGDSAKKTASEVTTSFGKIDKEAEKTATKTKNAFSSAFSGGFFGGLAGTIVSNFTSVLQQIPSKISDILDEAVSIAEEKSNALKGLESIANFKGVDPADAIEAVKNLRLVKAGIIDFADGATGLKNLLATGLSLEQSRTLLERFSDSAAFGKQAALSYGDAIKSATEGIKNQNSVLVDNAGVTKNISAILEDAGFKMEDLGDKTKKTSAINALYKGLVEETAAQVGDADKLTQGYTGSVAANEQAQKELYGAIGKLITQSPEMIAANRIQAKQIQGITSDLSKQGTETQKTAAQWISFFANIKAGLFPFAAIVKNTFLGIYTGLAGITAGIFGLITRAVEVAFDSIKFVIGSTYNNIVDTINKITDLAKSLPTVAAAPLGLSPLQLIPKIESRIDTSFDFSVSQKFFDGFNAALDDSDKYAKATGASVKELSDTLAELKKQSDELRKAEQDRLRKQVIKPKFFDSSGKEVTNESGSAGGDTKPAKTKSGKITDAGFEGFATNRQTAVYQNALRDLSPELRAQIVKTAEEYGIPTSLALAQIFSESSFNTKAKSPFNANVGQNAFGLTQFLPSTASSVLGKKTTGKDLFNSETALTAYGKYMTKLFEEFGDWEIAVFAYHNGEGAARDLVKALDSGNKSRVSSFAKNNPKGIAYAKKISALSGVSGKEQFQFADDDKEQQKQAKNEDEAAKRREQAQAKSLLSKIKDLDEEVSLRDSANKKILAEQETLLKKGEINEQGFVRVRAALDDDLLQKKKENKQKELNILTAFNIAEEKAFEEQAAKELERAKPEDRQAVEARLADERKALLAENFEEEKAVKIQLQKLDDDIAAQAQKNQQDISDASKKSVEDRKKNELELLQIRRDVAQAEVDLANFRAEQTRKILQNTVDATSGKARIAAIIELRVFELQDIERRRKARIKELDQKEADELEAASERLTNEEDFLKAELELQKKYKPLRDEANGKAAAEAGAVNTSAEPKTDKGSSENGERFGTKGLAGIFGLDDSALSQAKDKSELFKAVFNDLGDSVKAAAGNMVQAFGSAVESYVLYGGSIGKVLKQALAAELAHIAGVSAVKSVYFLAEGIAALFYDPAAAAGYFAASAIFGGIAIGTGLAGRALAGSGSKSAGGSFAGSTASGKNSNNLDLRNSDSNSAGNGNGGKAYSSITETRFQEEERVRQYQSPPQPQKQIIELHLKSNDSHIIETVNNDINSRGITHGTLVRIVEG